jgi:16S rRNA (cytosine1402-N4)-methyltransferase
MSYHVPVLLQESVEALALKPGGVYVDLTFGGGGHSKVILEHMQGGHLYGFDQDPDAEKQAADITDERFTFVKANFRHLKRYLRLHGVKEVDGILADLGISSHQINVGERGFSTRFEGPLDMRMDQNGDETAATVLMERSPEELHRIFGMYGEIKNARTLAQTIATQRLRQPLNTIGELKEAIKTCLPRGKENKYLAQAFQALRIEVNQELKALEEMLVQAMEVLKPGGHLAVISYHSLEDRLVKNFMQKGKFSGEMEKDFYGNDIRPLEPLTRKPIEASEEEQERNPRSRSGKLRIAVKL